MLQRITIIVRYFLFWVLYFIVTRLFFELYNIGQTSSLDFITIIGTFWHGLLLDMSMSGYVTALITFALACTIRSKAQTISTIVNSISVTFIIIFAIIGICDCELYRNWGFRMDSGVLMYLKTPKEAAASTPVWLTAAIIIWISLFSWLSVKAHKRIITAKTDQLQPTSWLSLPAILFMGALLVIPIRGGFGMPIRTGTVYFSNQQYANHAAINVQWNFCNSLTDTNIRQNDKFMPQEQAESIVKQMLKTDTLQCRLLNNSRPNIMIMLMESFTAKLISCTGGIEGVTPNLDSLARTGVLFSNCYANADRSDKGIVSILSGYPAQPTTSIMKLTKKASKLPHLSHKLNAEGYTSSFYYGGDIEFANMKSYFIMGDYNHIVSKSDFKHNEMNSKWGAHDHIVLNRWYSDVCGLKPPFFSVLFTLSSHEPFDVPHTSRFLDKTDGGKFTNTMHYTDSCIGDFVRHAAAEPWWQNTLLILISDHGSRLPEKSENHVPERFHIPMIWLGGALAKTDTVISEYVNQTDLPLILCNQLGLDGSCFSFSKDALSGSQSFALYSYNNGVGYISENEAFTYDRNSSKLSKANANDTAVRQCQAFLQTLLNDFNLK